MNWRYLGIIATVFIMLIAPVSAGLIFGGYAYSEAAPEVITPKEISENLTIKLYMKEKDTVEVLDFEKYICGVLLAEVPSDFHFETLKSMSVAVRSYCLRRIQNNYGTECHAGADVCDDYTHCLAYISFESACERWGEETASIAYTRICEAAEATRGEVLSYDGVVSDCVFHSNSFTSTENAEDVWGEDIPYLQSVFSPETYPPSYAEYTSEEFKTFLAAGGYKGEFTDDESRWVSGIELNASGRVASIKVCGIKITGRRIREIFNLKSTDFSLVYAEGFFTFTVLGHGHGVGMSQYGANALAGNGWNYDEILSHYYPGTQKGLY